MSSPLSNRPSETDADDWTLLLRAGMSGDARAYAAFLTAVTPVLRGIVRSRGKALGPAGCEDVVQEVLLAIHTKRHTWDQERPVRPWLYAIARHKVADAFRARGTSGEVDIADFAEVLPAPAGPDPTEAMDMDRMIGLLDDRSAAIVRGIGLEGATFAETGARHGLTEGAVRVALHRALKRLAALRDRHMG